MKISMPRGDIKVIDFTTTDDTGELLDIDFTDIYVTAKKSYNHAQYAFQKSLRRGEIEKLDTGHYQFTIRPEDTETLPYGDYVFDVELMFEDTIKNTFVGDFELLPEVTFASNEG